MLAEFSRRAHSVLATASLTCVLVVVASSSALAIPDFDGDGVLPPGDCEPFDPVVFPGAVDKPDLAFEDTNCDGLDGDALRAVFVAPYGNDLATGTKDFPKKTIGAALVTAVVDAGKDVYLAAGTYNEVVDVADNIGIYGGYAPVTWARSEAAVGTIVGSPQAVLADDDQGVVLQLLTLQGNADATRSAYAIRAIHNSRLALGKVTATAGPATAGPGGGTFPRPGKAGDGSPGVGCAYGDASRGARGIGGFNGGLGGPSGWDGFSSGGPGTNGLGPSGGSRGPGGAPSAAGSLGQPGGEGAIGDHGANGVFNSANATDVWTGGAAATGGGLGEAGSGGGGGGGSGGTYDPTPDPRTELPGNGGGGGGGGGYGGPGGGAGSNGGGSFGAYLFNSSLVAVASWLSAGDGGSGGDGGRGASGGNGGTGGAGGSASCLSWITLLGGPGGKGGEGGKGGDGGGGAGGPSAGVFRTGAGSAYAAHSTPIPPGRGGEGGLRGGVAGAPRGADGPAVGVLTAPSAPAEASADFDRDGVVDGSDDCPEIPKGGDASGDGCPDRPAKLVDSEGDGFPDVADRCPGTPRGADADEDGCPDPTANATARTIITQPVAPSGARRISAILSYAFTATRRFTILTRLQVRNLPAEASITVRCRGRRCPVKKLVRRRASGQVSLAPFTRKRLPVGTVLEVRIAKQGRVGTVKILTMRSRKGPSVRTLCVPAGAKKPAKC